MTSSSVSVAVCSFSMSSRSGGEGVIGGRLDLVPVPVAGDEVVVVGEVYEGPVWGGGGRIGGR